MTKKFRVLGVLRGGKRRVLASFDDLSSARNRLHPRFSPPGYVVVDAAGKVFAWRALTRTTSKAFTGQDASYRREDPEERALADRIGREGP